jgi:SAM-dependent methyltransferase
VVYSRRLVIRGGLVYGARTTSSRGGRPFEGGATGAIDPVAFREFERQGHDRVARSYRDFFEPVTAKVIEPLLDAASVRSGSRTLDIASGPGSVAAAAAARGADVIGIDLSRQMVAIARARHPRLDFREGDAEQLPFPTGRLDSVVCNFGIGHFARPESVAVEFVRVVGSGGHVALSWWDAPTLARVNGIFFDAMVEAGAHHPPSVPNGPPPYRFADEAELRALLTIAGLKDVTVRTLTWTHCIPAVDAWWEGGLASLVRASAGVLAQPPAMQGRIRAAFERLAEAYRTDDGLAVPSVAKIAAGCRR